MWLVGSSDNVKKAVAGTSTIRPALARMRLRDGGAGQSIMLNQENMNKLKETLEQAMKEMPEFEELKDQVKDDCHREALSCVELMETEKGMFFDSGSPDPSRNGQDVLAKLAEQLSKMKNTIMIEEHTDSRPIKGATGTETGSCRGTGRMRRAALCSSMPRADQVKQVRGFADQALLKSDDQGRPIIAGCRSSCSIRIRSRRLR